MIIAVVALAALALAPYALRRRRPGLLAVVSTGAADSVAALAAKLVAGELADGRWGAAIAVAALAAAAGALATVSEMSALQRLPATRVAPIVLAIQIVVPVVVVAALGGEDWGATAAGRRRARRRPDRGGRPGRSCWPPRAPCRSSSPRRRRGSPPPRSGSA